MGSQGEKRGTSRPVNRRKLALIVTGLVAVFSLLLSGLHTLFPALPGWDEFFVAAGLRESAPSAMESGRHAGFLFVDVGQGDCMVALGERVAVMIDAGPTDSVHRVRKALSDYGVERLNALILTHPHEDHIGGAAALLEQYPVDAVYLSAGNPDGETDRECFDALLDTARSKGIEPVRLSDSIELSMEEMTLSVYASPLQTGDENDNGLVVRAALPQLSALITGDAGTDAEFAFMQRGDRLDSDILKIGHHGSKTSTSPAFLRRVNPKAAVISVGRNSYGHPSPTVTSRLSEAGIAYYRTDINGVLFFDSMESLLPSAAVSSAA